MVSPPEVWPPSQLINYNPPGKWGWGSDEAPKAAWEGRVVVRAVWPILWSCGGVVGVR